MKFRWFLMTCVATFAQSAKGSKSVAGSHANEPAQPPHHRSVAPRCAFRRPHPPRDAMFHDDAVFESPVVHAPRHGKTIATKYRAGAALTVANSGGEYVGEWSGDNSVIPQDG